MSFSCPECEGTLLPALRSERGFLEGTIVLRLAVLFLILGLVAGILGFTGIAGASFAIAKFLFFIFLVIFLVFLVLGLAAARKLTGG
jgi:uncharacterized membrane protein YtjA (UPF0391 family)